MPASSATLAAYRQALSRWDEAEHHPFLAWLDEGVDVETRSSEGETLLYLACWHGRTDLMDGALRRNANPDAVDASGRTPLMAATRADAPEFIQRLLAAGAALEATDDRGNTALHHASRMHKAVALDALLVRGASVGAVNEAGEYPIHALIDRLLIDRIDRAGAALGSLPAFRRRRAACEHAPILALVRRLMASGARLDQGDLNGDALLGYAVQSGHWALALSLVGLGAQTHRENRQGQSPATLPMAPHDEEDAAPWMAFLHAQAQAHTLGEVLEGADDAQVERRRL